jgi:hypothetical protein
MLFRYPRSELLAPTGATLNTAITARVCVLRRLGMWTAASIGIIPTLLANSIRLNTNVHAAFDTPVAMADRAHPGTVDRAVGLPVVLVVGRLRRELMAPFTVGSLAVMQPMVVAVQHRSQMGGIHTRAIVTDMMEMQSIGNRSYGHFVGYSMGLSDMTSITYSHMSCRGRFMGWNPALSRVALIGSEPRTKRSRWHNNQYSAPTASCTYLPSFTYTEV